MLRRSFTSVWHMTHADASSANTGWLSILHFYFTTIYFTTLTREAGSHKFCMPIISCNYSYFMTVYNWRRKTSISYPPNSVVFPSLDSHRSFGQFAIPCPVSSIPIYLHITDRSRSIQFFRYLKESYGIQKRARHCQSRRMKLAGVS